MNIRRILSIPVFCILALSTSCTHEKLKAPVRTYPEAIGNIIETKCAVAGCHNQASYQNAGGLLLDTWEHMFNGADNGATVIPFAADNSSLLYFINTHSALGPIATPTMPLNGTPLSEDEYLLVKNWIANGAPDYAGVIPFASEAATRQKIYVTMQGCDLIGVIDAEKKVVMRYISVGKTEAIENPHCVRVSADGLFAYVSFLGGEYVQKIDTRTDSIVGEIQVGIGSWNIFHLSPDGKQMVLSDWQPKPNGRVLLINTETMSIVDEFGGLFNYPHGIASNADFTTFFVTAQYGNTVYKLRPNTSVPFKELSIDGQPPVVTAGVRDPHEILMVPDHSKYFLTCEYSNEIRVMDAIGDTILKVIPVGIKPQEMAISPQKHCIYVTCMEDNSPLTGFKGSVYVINYETYETTRIDGPFYQPHGIAVDEKAGIFYVVSRNANPNGPAPHHSSSCAGRNGYYNVYDLNTLQRLPRRYEVTVEPYSADTRFK